MHKRSRGHSFLVAATLLACFVLRIGPQQAQIVTVPPAVALAQTPAPDFAGATIPFELITRHIALKVRVNNSRPLTFIFDTGDQYAIINLERAKELGLNLSGSLSVSGAG